MISGLVEKRSPRFCWATKGGTFEDWSAELRTQHESSLAAQEAGRFADWVKKTIVSVIMHIRRCAFAEEP